jgi:hypothetical protein
MPGNRYDNPLHRQRYRLRNGVSRDDFVTWPDWLKDGGAYAGDIDPSSQHSPDLWIRLRHPSNADLSFLITEADLEEVD